MFYNTKIVKKSTFVLFFTIFKPIFPVIFKNQVHKQAKTG